MTKLEVFRDGELYLILRDGVYCVHGMQDGRRIRKSCQTTELGKAKIILESLKREHDSGWRLDYDDPSRDWKTVAGMICRSQEQGAMKRGIPFELRPSDVYHMMKETSFRCAVSGVPFAKRMANNGKRDPWAPSIDRIENRQGYCLDNTRVVSLAANLAMNEWGHDVLLRLARGVVRSAVLVSDELTPKTDTVSGAASKFNGLKIV